MYLIDSHCHLNIRKKFANFDPHNIGEESRYTPKEIIKRANAVNVKYILAISTELSDIEELQDIIDNHENIFCTVGIHPLEAKKHCQKYSIEDITRIMSESCENGRNNQQTISKIIGIGEIGLDYHYDMDSVQEQQQLFDLQLDMAKKYDLPVCIHSREAEEDTICTLKNHPGSKGIIHCFSGSKDFAMKALDLGFYISVSGVITFKNSSSLCEIVKTIPINRLLIETDAPFLAPMPFRGKINEPAYLVYVSQKLAEILGLSTAEIAEETSKNFINLFSNYFSSSA